jgi:hypothetical protein
MKVSNLVLFCPLVLLPASSYGTNIKVVVGFNNTLRFEPPNFNSTPGDIITFEFHQKSHSGKDHIFFPRRNLEYSCTLPASFSGLGS